MRLFQHKSAKLLGALAIVLGCVAIGTLTGAMHLPWSTAADDALTADAAKPSLAVELVEGKPHTLFVPEDVRNALGIRNENRDSIAVARKPTSTRPLLMPGST